MSTDVDRLAEKVMDEMLRFGEGVLQYQLRDQSREDFDYSDFDFDAVCHSFMAGAMMVISERYALRTSPKQVALLGLLKYLTIRKGWTFAAARERVATIDDAAPGSTESLLFDAGYAHWRRPDALKALCRMREPAQDSDEPRIEAGSAPSSPVLRRLVLGAGAVVLLMTGWLLGRFG